MDKTDKALALFTEGFNCSQAVLAVFAEELGLEQKIALRIACGFGGGMRMGGTCGAVSGACMVIGLKYGKDCSGDTLARDKTYALVKELAARFRSLHTSVHCHDLIGCDLGTPEGYAQAVEKGVFHDLCPRFIVDAVKILQEIL